MGDEDSEVRTTAKGQSRQEPPGYLRRRAEDALSRKKTGEPSTMPEEDVRALVHELQVHQIELEMQNEELKRANALVEETRNRYVDLYELAPVGYLTLDENGIVFEANLTAAGQLGIERSSLIKRPFQDCIVPADRDKFRSHLNQVVTSRKRQSCEIRLMTKSGSDLYALLDTVFILDSTGRKLCRTTATDITERKNMEEALRESEKQSMEQATYLRTVLDAAPAIILTAHDGDCRTISGNRAAIEFLRVPEDANLSKTGPEAERHAHYRIFLKGRELTPPEMPIQRVVATGEPLLDCAFEYVFDDGAKHILVGNVVPLLKEGGELGGAVAAYLDITRRKRAEEALKESQKKLKEAHRLAGIGIWDWAVDTDTVYWSDELYDIAGRDKQLPAPSYREQQQIFAPESWDLLTRAVERALISGEHYQLELRLIRPDGTTRWVNAFGGREYDGTQRLRGLHGTVQDITERKFMEEGLTKSRDTLELRVLERTTELRESEERLRCLSGRLLTAQEEERKRIGGEIHDSIGSSLASVNFALEAARSKALQLNGEQLQDLLEFPLLINKKAIEETRRIHTGMRPPILDDIGLIATIGWYCREFQQGHPQIHIEVEVDIEENQIPEPLKIVIFRILQESLNNIAKYSKAEFVNLALIKTSGAIDFAIEDNGIGFDVDEILSRANCDRGLGLTSMTERALLAGGNLTIQSIPGEGTTIRGSWSIV